MFKSIGHFIAVAAHAVITGVKKVPAVLEKAGAVAAQAEAVAEKFEPTINAAAGILAPGSEPVLKAMEHIFGDAAEAFIAGGAAAESGFTLSVTADAAQKLKTALGHLAGKPIVPAVPLAPVQS